MKCLFKSRISRKAVRKKRAKFRRHENRGEIATVVRVIAIAVGGPRAAPDLPRGVEMVAGAPPLAAAPPRAVPPPAATETVGAHVRVREVAEEAVVVAVVAASAARPADAAVGRAPNRRRPIAAAVRAREAAAAAEAGHGDERSRAIESERALDQLLPSGSQTSTRPFLLSRTQWLRLPDSCHNCTASCLLFKIKLHPCLAYFFHASCALIASFAGTTGVF